ncbi:MAG: hypothetical protein HRU27_11695 [Rhizobiaceae bacterium]|nr:hypothetical protein [Hyphomicrobiales bacterium]NRB31245.1 hypothetical protein [Rhizobiaceae bacterium]
MQQISVERSTSGGFIEGLQKALAEISTSTDLSAACGVFAEFLESLEAQLLSVKFCDINDRSSNLRPYSTYHKAMHRFRAGPGYPDGCPFSREAMKRLRPFSLQSIDRRAYGNLEDRRFFKELESTGHMDIAVLPVMIGRGLALMTVGLGKNSFSGPKRTLISDTATHFVAAIVARFPDVSRLFERKVLSEAQRQVVLLACEGHSDDEIARQLNLSTVAIGLIFNAAAERLRTKTRSATVYHAVVLGEVPSGSHLSKCLVFHKDVGL